MTIPTPPVDPVKALADLTTYCTWSAQTIGSQAGQVDTLTAQVGSLVADKDRLTAENTALVATNARLTRELAECLDEPDPPDPPDPPSLTRKLGASLAEDDGVLADARRTYNGGFLPPVSTSDSGDRQAVARSATGGVVWTSWKMEGGRLPSESALRSALGSLSDHLKTKNLTGLVTFEHEPDIKGGIPPAQYHAGYDLQDRVITAFSNLQSIVVLTGFVGDKGDTSVWETYWRPNHAMIGADHYNKGMQQSGEPLDTPANNWGNLVKFAKSKGKPLCIGESGAGTDSTPGPVIKTRPDWYKAHREYTLDPVNNIIVVTMFNARQTIMSAADIKAWYGK